MPTSSRIQLSRYEFAHLISEVDGLCPLCSKKLLQLENKTRQAALSQAAHIFPHSPSNEEKLILKDVPMLSSNVESLDNLILLCPTCHYEFDHPRTYEGYMKMYMLKKQLSRRYNAREYYQRYNIEDDIISVLQKIGEIDTYKNTQKLSYKALTISAKMSVDATAAVKNMVSRDAIDYYLPIQDALFQLEKDSPGKSDLIAKEVALFYTQLKASGLSQDNIYYSINDWIDQKTQRQYGMLTPFITAFYIQNCEVFS